MKFHVGSQVWQTPEEGLKTYRLKRCGNNNKDEDNSLKTVNDKKHQALSQKFRQPYEYRHILRMVWVKSMVDSGRKKVTHKEDSSMKKVTHKEDSKESIDNKN